MNDTLINTIQKFTLQARADLEREAHEQLEGIYGWLSDGTFAPERRYPAVTTIEEARATRARLEQYARDEDETGHKAIEARVKLVRETAYTWLNRFVAFKMLEARRLLKVVVSRLTDSNAYLFWLADEHDPEARHLHDAGETPTDILSEGPRHRAYRHFLLWQCGELAREISVLFDPATLASSLCPRPNALRALVDTLNRVDLSEAWQPGNEESLGWIYQAFNAEEKDAVFKGFSKGKKVTAEQIASATQIFTPRWVVRYLVENSLGRLWVEMHPESFLNAHLQYLVPVGNDTPLRTVKPAREILFLDPACGSMHFGLVAFDIYVEMYREEIARAGQPGWPARPSVVSEEKIPAAIVANNIHGIDIDLRAVQLSSLALLIKARTINPGCAFNDRNVACCNIEAITGGRLDEMIRGARFSQPVHERILRSMTVRLKGSDNLGSLLRPEKDLEKLIDEERQKIKRDQDKLPGFRESDLWSLDTPEHRERFFAGMAEEMAQRLDDFVRQSREIGRDESYFVGEASKGLRFLRLVQQRYDVVATNPPYMSRRNQSPRMALFLKDEYASSKTDLYAAFIARCVELTNPLGKTAMITQQSFMFISSYEVLRDEFRKDVAIENMLHLGPRAFATVAGEKVNTTAFVLQKQPEAKLRENNIGVYFRLVRERDAEAKRATFEASLAALQSGQYHSCLFRYTQQDFDAIPGSPWVYWIPTKIRSVFVSGRKLSFYGLPKHGMSTGDNYRFLRYWWETGLSSIEKASKSVEASIHSGARWFPYMKGGTFCRWYGNQASVLNYWNGGSELLAAKTDGTCPGHRHDNPDYYFRRGVTWSFLTSGRFSARLSPGGFIFDVAGSSFFPDNIYLFLALLNSTFIDYLLKLLNPTVNYQVGDLTRLPVPAQTSTRLESLVQQAITLAKEDSVEDETTSDYVGPPMWGTGIMVKGKRYEKLAKIEQEINDEVYILYGINKIDRKTIVNELKGNQNQRARDDETEDGSADGNQNDGENQGVGIDRAELGRRWISYVIGIVLGRYGIGKSDSLGRGVFDEAIIKKIKSLVQDDGLLADDPWQPRDLSARVLATLEVMLGKEDATGVVRVFAGDGEPIEALVSRIRGNFWKEHFKQYRKRPIYWPLQSPGKHYTVWLFHEKLGPDTLFHIRTGIVEPRLRLAEREIADLRTRASKDRRTARDLDRLLDFSDDLRAFSANLKAVTDRGYTPHIDDGVLLNAAPLHLLLPSWPETLMAWKELEAGEFDWAHQAMDYWPDRVKEKCRVNRSFAIAHGLVEPELEETPAKRKSRKGKSGKK